MNTNQQNEWLTIEQVEEQYHMSRSMQAQYRMEKKIPFTKLGRKILYSRSKLNEWLESLEVGQ